ncbi:MAG: CapA family protein [Roseburia sp.]|nr:CapA family protein [Roseburia sp.]
MKRKIRKRKIVGSLALTILLATQFLACKTPAESETAAKESVTEVEAASETKEDAGINLEHKTGEKAPEISYVTISMAGDCTLGNTQLQGYAGTFNEMYDQKGPAYFFQNVRDIFEADDMTIVNFEGVLTESDDKVEKAYNLKGKPEYNQILVDADIEAASLGNNHRIDYGKQGMIDTQAALDEIGLTYAYDDVTDIYETKDGVKIGIVSVDEVYDGTKVETYLQDGIARLKEEGANIILACCHWGIEHVYYPESYQTELGQKCIDWGADFVIGCHPHVLQGIDNYHGKYMLYSLGNFCFGGNRNPQDKGTMIAQVTFQLEDGVTRGEARLQVIPCTLSSVTSRNDFCPTPAQGEKRESIIENLNTYSQSFGVSIDQDGWVSHDSKEEQ